MSIFSFESIAGFALKKDGRISIRKQNNFENVLQWIDSINRVIGQSDSIRIIAEPLG